MGAILSEINEIDESIFLVAARTLAETVSDVRLKQGALYPDQSELRSASSRITVAIVRHASHNRLGRDIPDEEIEQMVADATWYPEYVPVVATVATVATDPPNSDSR
jgi:malic enzyme